jgi:FtsP/CotA-like multicopper oxidase with cupredoxin domain
MFGRIPEKEGAEMSKTEFTLTRRDLLRLSVLTGGATLIGSRIMRAAPAFGEAPAPGIDEFTGCGVGGEAFSTSPLILEPFSDSNPLPIPKTMRPGWRHPDGTLAAPGSPDAWKCRVGFGTHYSSPQVVYPGSEAGHQDSFGDRPRWAGIGGPQVPNAGTHQLWPGTAGTVCANYPQPIYYHIRLQLGTHYITNSRVQPIDRFGVDVVPPDGIAGPRLLPGSTIYGFNGAFPGALINVEYGRPVCVRFENDLDYNPGRLDRQDFGAPDWAFLTHLHNGHTAPECDGNPHHMTDDEGGYRPGHWSDNLYLMHPPGGDPNEKQSFLWFHDHRMHHTGANVYKGMVGLMPHYDPVLDPGDERISSGKRLRLPGIRTENGDGTFDVKYDIPLALYDHALDDGVTPHQDFHNGCGETHPEWWGKSFFRHYPNHGFVGDIFTVNCKAYPVLHVERRRYRLRFLGASIARCYDLWLMAPGTRGVVPSRELYSTPEKLQGQFQLPDGEQCMKLTQIASEGGLLPKAIVRDHFEIWPAKRREFVVDFSKYMDGTPTTKGDVIYLVNTMYMPNGRKPVFPGELDFDPNYKVPMLKIVIGDLPAQPDKSASSYSTLRPMPALPKNRVGLPTRHFRLDRGAPGNRQGPGSAETEWLINGLEFDPLSPLALPKMGVPEIWTVQNGGGGWTHPMHMHQEEHTVLSRTGLRSVAQRDGTDAPGNGKEDVVNLDPGESVTFYRNFRTFMGNYVAHCHNLAHEDHNMMFGFAIVPPGDA